MALFAAVVLAPFIVVSELAEADAEIAGDDFRSDDGEAGPFTGVSTSYVLGTCNPFCS